MTRALAVAIGVALLVPAAAWARPRVALVAFEGDASGEVQDVVAELIEGDYAIAGPKQVGRTIDKLGLDSEMSEKDLKKLANELDADAIVRGDLQQKGPRKLLHVRLYVGGKRVRGFKVEFASVKSQKFKDALKDKMLEKLGGEERPAKKKVEPGPDGDAEETKPKKKKKGDDDPAEKRDDGDSSENGDEGDKGEIRDNRDDDDSGARKRKKRTAVGSDDEEIGGEINDGVTATRSSPHTANRAAIRVDFGGSFSSRNLSFTSRSFEQAPNPYSNVPVPGVRVGGELYPLAFGNPDGFAGGLGIGGSFDQTTGLKLRSTAQPGTEFPVAQKYWTIGARFRIVFGRKATSPSATLAAGYFHRMFKVDRTQLAEGNIIDLPDVFYQGFNPGLEIRIPVAGSVSLILGGRAILVTSAGQITKGQEYGQAKVTGGDAVAGLEVVIAKRFAARLTGEGTQIGYAFVGNGEMSNNRDGTPDTVDVGGAADRYIGGALTFAVLY